MDLDDGARRIDERDVDAPSHMQGVHGAAARKPHHKGSPHMPKSRRGDAQQPRDEAGCHHEPGGQPAQSLQCTAKSPRVIGRAPMPRTLPRPARQRQTVPGEHLLPRIAKNGGRPSKGRVLLHTITPGRQGSIVTGRSCVKNAGAPKDTPAIDTPVGHGRMRMTQR